LASFYGARIAEVPIRNVPREAGTSHYGIGRTFRVMFDILTIQFLLRYMTRPMHFFGKLGGAGLLAATGLFTYLLGYKLLGGHIMVQHGPLLILAVMSFLAGLMLFGIGLMGEVLMRTYFESSGRRIYAVRDVRMGQQEASTTEAHEESES
ncbi:MAG: glycosyltransferase, partial [Bryobacterales bacterium]|nr:glycosyltransferase [Bryobacterales bacterium]